ncbi:MAG: helix-turn-helix transcriptional regulator [Clostridiales bacterium]|nr:helix-turn-helix transcriptional regulator [Clostridiales bacterium]
MYKPKLEKDIRCPLEYAMDLFGGKWKPRIICMLGLNGTMRYAELKKELENISDTVLAATLKEMINDELVERIQYNEMPLRVEYSLTEEGKSTVPVLANMCLWADAKLNDTDKPRFCTKCYYKRK